MSRARTTARVTTGRRQSVRAVEVGATVLRALGRLGGCASLSGVAGAVDLPASKAHRYLKALIGGGFVEQDGHSGDYRLGVESLRIGLAALAGLDIVALAAPPLARLSVNSAETAMLSIWSNAGATVVHVAQPPRRVTVVTRLGSVLPLLTSATGLAFAAYLPAAETHAMKAAELNASANGRPPSKRATAELEKGLREIRTAGIATVHSLLFPGIDAVAAPVFGTAGRITAVLTVLGPATSFDALPAGWLTGELRATAAELSTRLGYPSNRPATARRTRSKSAGVSTPGGGASTSVTK